MAGYRTIPNVELVHVGDDWQTLTGSKSWTSDDLYAAVAAQDDPAVRAPVIKFGHLEKRFGDGQPAFGRVTNLRVANNGMALVGDYEGVPDWLADSMPSAYPRRSVEGWFNYTTATGNFYSFMVTGVALLGAEYPAITTLDDLKLVLSAESIDDIELVAASHGGNGEAFVAVQNEVPDQSEPKEPAVEPDAPTPAEPEPEKVQAANNETLFAGFKKILSDMLGSKPQPVQAQMSHDDVRQAFYDYAEEDGTGMFWWWVRVVNLDPFELIVDDDEDGLWRIPFKINGDEVTFEEGTEVVVQYVDKPDQVAASHGPSTKRVYATKADSKPVISNPNQRGEKLTKEQLEVLGLPEDASQEDVDARLKEVTEAAAAQAEAKTEPEGDEPKGDEPGETQTTEPEPEPALAGKDEDIVTIDRATLDELKVSAARADELFKKEQERERDAQLAEAVSAGKILPAKKAAWASRWDADPEGTKATIELLEAGKVPTKEVGHQNVQASAAEYPESWKRNVRRKESI